MEKQVFYTNNTNTHKNDRNINDLRQTIVEFFVRNGIDRSHAESYVRIDYENIIINASCSNNNYTRAIAALMLISSFNSFGFYTSFSSRIIKIVFRTSEINETIDAINYPWKITIE